MDPQTELLLRKSAVDEQTLQVEKLHDLIFGFHAQQAVEKLLKALLARLGKQYPRSRDLERLRADLLSVGEKLPSVPAVLADLNDYAVEYRYDDPLPPIVLDRDKAIETVKILREFVHRRVRELDCQSASPAP